MRNVVAPILRSQLLDDRMEQMIDRVNGDVVGAARKLIHEAVQYAELLVVFVVEIVVGEHYRLSVVELWHRFVPNEIDDVFVDLAEVPFAHCFGRARQPMDARRTIPCSPCVAALDFL